jgi:predicted DCC family thiol-disulfide oxidoreductase YuxK
MSATNEQGSESAMAIVYDGECPFCRSYVTLMKLRTAVGAVDLVDARTGGPIVEKLIQQGYDLNEGMAAVYGDRIYYGKDAVVLISTMTGKLPWTGRVLAALLRNKTRAALIYPVMKLGRKITLKALGVAQI